MSSGCRLNSHSYWTTVGMEGRNKRYGALLRTELLRVREEGGRALAALYGLALLTRTKSMDGERLWRLQLGHKPLEERMKASATPSLLQRADQGLYVTECLVAKQGWTHRGRSCRMAFSLTVADRHVNVKESYGWDG